MRRLIVSEIVNSREIFNLWCSRDGINSMDIGYNYKAVASAAGEFVFRALV